jgi:hypothetical protein
MDIGRRLKPYSSRSFLRFWNPLIQNIVEQNCKIMEIKHAFIPIYFEMKMHETDI